MATLIKSKQIQGTVTASAVSGDFQVSGSFQHTGSLEVQGSVTASGDIQATTFKGDGSLLSGVESTGRGIFSGSQQLPTGLISSSEQFPSGVVSGSSQLYTDLDARYGNELGDGLVSGSVLRPGGDSVISSSAQVNYNSLQNTPEGLVSASIQILGGTDIVSGSVIRTLNGTDIVSSSAQITALGFVSESGGGGGSNESLNSFTASYYTDSASFDTRIDGISASGSGANWNVNLSNIPTGRLSGSKQITDFGFISSSDSITSLNSYTSSTDGRLSGIDSFTSSIQTEVDGISAATSSYLTSSGSVDYTDLTSVPTGILSSSEQITDFGFISESAENTSLNAYTASNDINITNIHSTTSSLEQRVGEIESNTGSYSGGGGDVTHLNTFTSSIQTEVDGLSAATSSYITSLPSGLLSGSKTEIPSGTVSSSAQITALGFVSSSSSVPAGTISGSGQITSLGFISSSDSTTSLNSYTSSTDVRINQLASATGSYISGLDSGIVSGAGQIGGLGYISGSQVSSSISFDGNRVVSNTDLPSGVYNNNFGTSGSIMEFVESVFFPNTAPTINSVSFSIDEYEDTNSIIGTVSATDAEGQTITFATQSGYSADKFTIHSSTGVITARARTTSSLNTDTSVYAGGAHPFLIKATDTFSGTTNKTIHIRVTPNTAPKFREGSAGGTQITSVASSFNENSSNNSLVKRVYFTDDESDSITLTSTSIDNNHFDIHKYSNYFDIRQNTGSLDYEVQSLYTFAVTASDEHFLSASQGTVGQTILPISVSVTDNVHPTINNQTLSSISENSSNGAAVATISATDNEGDTITFSDFTLYKLELDDANVASSSYGGTSQSDPTNDAFQCSGTGAVTRKNGVYINSDLINEYQYTVRIRDSYNTASNEAIITIPITDDTAPTVSDNWTTPYVIESAVSGASVYVSSNGRSGTIAAFSANQSVTWTLNSGSGVFDINSSNGRLSIKTNLSGSTTSSGDLLSGSSIATNTFGTATETPFTTSVAANQAPSISFTDQSAKFETDLALNGVTMVSMSVSDDESDTPFSASLSGSDVELVYSNANSSSIGLHLTGNATARQYFYSVTITDQFGKSQTYSDRSFTITESPDYGKVYVYRSDYGSDSGLSSNYSSVMGISTTNAATPPEVTAFTANDTSPMRLISSSLGDASLSLAGGATATRVAILSGSNLDTILSASSFSMGGGANQYIVITPSGSDMIGVPTSMTDSFGGSTAGQYVMAINADGGSWGAESSIVHLLDTSGSVNGYDKHFVIGRKGHNAANTVLMRIIASSGSLPS